MNTRWLYLEYTGKGVCLALPGLLALETLLAEKPPGSAHAVTFFGAATLGLVLLLGVAAWRKAREGYQVRGRVPAFLLFLILENPVLVYAGVLGGMLAGAGLLLALADWTWWHLLAALGGGIVLGGLFRLLREVQNRWVRGGTILLLAAAAAAGIVFWLESRPDLLAEDRHVLFGLNVLLAIPLLYVLTLAGQAEETEVEIGSMCVALGVALWILLRQQAEGARAIALMVPIAIYLLYTQRILKGLKVFKHVLRGMSYNNLGLHRQALLAYRRALQIDPANERAREGQWRVHKDMDFNQAVHDPETMALVNIELCLERARELLVRPSPGPDRLEEAHKLLTLVLDQRPAMQPAVYYWRAVAHTHAKEFDKAEAELRTVLDASSYAPDDAYRQSVLLPCWQLALLQHGELKKRVGTPLLAHEGRRLEAIAAVEQQLATSPDDAGAWELKRFLYDGLTEADYRVRAAAEKSVPVTEFDHDYCLQLGLASIGDTARWQRGAEYLRIAACGMPERGPSIYYQIAQACQRAGDEEGSRGNSEMVKRSAREIGLKNLAAEDQHAYFATVKQLGEAAYARGDVDKAIENLTLYTESNQSGVDTLRTLTELYEKKGDALSALHINEKALFYDGKNKLLLERKDRYYYSVQPGDLAARLEQVRKSFDVGYCVRKAKSLLDLKASGAEQVDWAVHLLELARIVEPNNIAALVLCARAHLRRGEVSDAIPLLEEVRSPKPERFASSEEEDAWYTASRLLGDFYLQTLGKPDQAIQCYSDYRKYSKSGADTLYKMGQCYEQLGDRVKAAKCYQNVTVFSDHPLASDAHLALQRLGTSGS